MANIYPLTIVSDRYSGVYSGGQFTAWNMAYNDIPLDPILDDVSCMYFWDTTDIIIGRGETPQDAIEDLIKRL